MNSLFSSPKVRSPAWTPKAKVLRRFRLAISYSAARAPESFPLLSYDAITRLTFIRPHKRNVFAVKRVFLSSSTPLLDIGKQRFLI